MTREYTRPLERLSRSDEPGFGGKSANLGELLAAEIPVPPGFAISTAAYEAFVRDAGLAGTIDDALAGAAGGDVDAVAAASRAIGEAMRAAPVPDDVREEVAEQYAQLGDAAPVAVRSSAVGEDSAEATFAGQQETYLWVRGADHVCDAVRDCWISLYSPPAITYRARLGEAKAPPAMGVTVQLMVDAEVSGVMFTCNPVSGDPSMVAINASWGLGLAVVGGEVTPDDFLISKVTGEVVREHVHSKDVEYVPDASGAGAVRVEVPAERRDVACLDHERLTQLVAVAKRVDGYFGSRQDIEWAIARGDDDDDGLFVVQARPVTGLAKKPDKPKPASAMSLIMSTFGAAAQGRLTEMALSDEDVREILRIIDESTLTELRIETEGFSLHVVKGAARRSTRPRSPAPVEQPPAPATAPSAASGCRDRRPRTRSPPRCSGRSTAPRPRGSRRSSRSESASTPTRSSASSRS